MTGKIEKLGGIFEEMVENYDTFGKQWANIPLAKEALAIMNELPDSLENEYETPAEKAMLLCRMVEYVEDRYTPRLCIAIREYAADLFGEDGDEDNEEALEQLRDYINLEMPMDDYCLKHSRMLRFDPVERTEEWENVIYDVMKECDRRLEGESPRMGFCFSHWSTMRTVLEEYGISWRDPHLMNPGVMFD